MKKLCIAVLLLGACTRTPAPTRDPEQMIRACTWHMQRKAEVMGFTLHGISDCWPNQTGRFLSCAVDMSFGEKRQTQRWICPTGGAPLDEANNG